eukprot:scaffold447_cov307-Pinguiococcus_pyrenoidosus.AAC.28
MERGFPIPPETGPLAPEKTCLTLACAIPGRLKNDSTCPKLELRKSFDQSSSDAEPYASGLSRPSPRMSIVQRAACNAFLALPRRSCPVRKVFRAFRMLGFSRKMRCIRRRFATETPSCSVRAVHCDSLGQRKSRPGRGRREKPDIGAARDALCTLAAESAAGAGESRSWSRRRMPCSRCPTETRRNEMTAFSSRPFVADRHFRQGAPRWELRG